MMYPYMTLADETEITHSHLIEEDGMQCLEVHFERPKEGGFDVARCALPTYTWIKRDGFSDKEIENFSQFLLLKPEPALEAGFKINRKFC